MRKPLLYLLIFALLLLVPIVFRYLQFYRPFAASRAEPPVYSAAGIAAVPTPAAGNYPDTPRTETQSVSNPGSGDGVAVLDMAHRNQFSREEITYLDGLLAARGFRLSPLAEGDLTAALRPAAALVVITPIDGYSPADVRAVQEFVARGGRVLLIGDPTRYNVEFDENDIFAPPIVETAQVPLNDLSAPFDITFRGDYLYNTVENEGNFRNILLGEDGLAGGTLTDGLSRLALYSSHSLLLGPTAAPVLSADDNTWSSATDRPGGLTLAALSPATAEGAGQVLAVGDVHFLTEPYNSVYDNGAFAGRVADFLAGGDGSAGDLAAFPFFFRSPVDLVYSEQPDLGPDAFDEIVALQQTFREDGLALGLAAEPSDTRDTLYLGLYNRAADVRELLTAAGIELVISPRIAAPSADATPDGPTAVRAIRSNLGDVRMSGTGLILLADDGERRQVVALAASNDGLERVITRLRAGDLSGCLQQAALALCPTLIDGEPVEYELDTSGPPEPQPQPTPPPDNAPDRPGGDEPVTVEAVDRGPIAVGETKRDELAEKEAHSWTFSGGPATIDIVVQSDADIDAILELYGPDDKLLANADSTFAGGREELNDIDIPDDGDYRIVVRDYFDDGGGYELTVDEAGGGNAGAPGNRVFIFADDDGQPLGEGLTSAAVFAQLLAGDYEVTTWTASDDGPLPDDALQNIDLLIWESGTYRDEEGLFGDDSATILGYLNDGGDVLFSGASPTILGPVELAPLSAVAVVADDATLSRGFDEGDVIELNGAYRVALPEATDSGADEYRFLERAPGEEGEGAVVGIGGIDRSAGGQRTIFLFAPFVALPAAVQVTLLANIMEWFQA